MFDTCLTTGNPLLGKAFHIRDTIKGRYFYPREPGMRSVNLRIDEKHNTLRPSSLSLSPRDAVRLLCFTSIDY